MPIVIGVLLLVIVLLIGGAVLGVALNLIWYLLVGVVIGALARLVVPGKQAIGLLSTSLYGIAGALVGGMLADELFGWGLLGSLALSVAVAAALVAVFGGLAARGGGDRHADRG